MEMAITLQNARGHLAVHTKGKKALRKGSYFPDGLAVLLKVSAQEQSILLSAFHFLPYPLTLEKGSGLLLFVCIVVREPSSTC